MCPDEETLSAYLDDEVEEPFRSKIKEHIEKCEKCSLKLDTLKKIRLMLLDNGNTEYIDSMERVKRRIQISLLASGTSSGRKTPLYKRKWAIPIPIAIAAIFAFLFMTFLFVVNFPNDNGIRMMRIRTEPTGTTEVQVTAPIEDLEQLLKFIDNSSFKREVIINLPVESQFLMVGKPAIIKERDLSGVR